MANASPDPLVRVQAQRVQADVLYRVTRRLPVAAEIAAAARRGALAGLKDIDALVRRCAAEALGNFLKTANQEIIDSYPSYKDDVRMLSIYGMFYNGVGDAVSAERVLTSAHMLAPNKQLITFDLMRAQLIGKQFKEAYDLGKETYDLSATCRDALKWYMVSAAYAGKYAEAKAYALSKGQDPGVDPDVIGGVIASGQTALGIELLIQAKKQNPALTSEVDALIKQLLAKKR